MVLSLSSDFFLHRSWRWKSDAKLAHAAPSSLSLLVPHGAGCNISVRLALLSLVQRAPR
ncbi:hypothetical protein GCM10008014_27890 [Paenibacillus silvae]|uniref:Uncharacterized protein n=1 Tax=Paenibacillus silvae TaxID=1325358 RepID=A0ABQ1ZD55_9BACL|nr:hypothetical protein GCM10008014_27890 [Paenibacillus silvae]